MKEPDKLKIERWLAGRLEGSELEIMENWAVEHPDDLENAMGWDETGNLLKSELASDVEPPYAEFFNRKVEQHALDQVENRTDEVSEKTSIWQRFGLLWATAAVAGMAVCFYIGGVIKDGTKENLMAGGSEVYIPQEGVTAQVSETGSVTVIALEGLDDIPESLDIVNGETSVGGSREYYVRTENSTEYY